MKNEFNNYINSAKNHPGVREQNERALDVRPRIICRKRAMLRK
jgi:hypothetical protein